MLLTDPALINSVQNSLVVTRGLTSYWSCHDGSGTVVRDFCGNKNFSNGLFQGSPAPTWAPGRMGAGLSLNGSSAYVSIPEASYQRPGSSALSIAFWFNAPNANQTAGCVVSKRDPSTFNQFQCGIGQIDSGGASVAGKTLYTCTNSPLTCYHTNNNYADGTWHHVVFLRPASGAHQIYVDGISVAVTANVDGGVVNITTTTPWLIGWQNSVGASFYNGLIDDVRIYFVQLTPSEIMALYQAS